MPEKGVVMAVPYRCPTCGQPVPYSGTHSGNLVSEIQVTVAAHYEVPLAGLKGPSRRSEWALARHVAMFLAVEMSPFSFAKVAKIFGRDPSSVSYGVRRITDLLHSEEWIRHDIDALRRKLSNLAAE